MYVDLEECLVCGGKDLTRYLQLGIQPPANSYTNEPEEVPAAPLEMMLCRDCSHSQLSVVVDPDILFKDYIYVSGTTKTLENHFKAFAEDCTKRFPGKGMVLEIGCNDGSCLRQMKAQGWNVLGIDPAQNLDTPERGVPVIVGYWGIDMRDLQEFDLIYGMNVFAHNLNPSRFIQECYVHLKPGGTLILEMPYALNTFKTLDFGQFYHEHLNLFGVRDMAKLLSRWDMAIVDIVETSVHGGSIRFFIQYDSVTCEKALNMIKAEKLLGMNDVAFYEKFRKDVMGNISQILQAAGVQKQIGYKLVAYGAAAKLSTLINAVGQDALPLEYVVDDNPFKCGKYIPGTSIPIVPTHTLEGEDRLCILFGAHNFKEEIKERLRARRRQDQHDVCLHWVPKVEIEDLFDA